MSYDYSTLAVKDETEAVYEQAKSLIEDELDGRVTNDKAVREFCEAYLGRHACGEWQDIEYKLVAKGTTPPDVWHTDPDCKSTDVDLSPVPADEIPDSATSCTYCGNGLSAPEIREKVKADGGSHE
jgi:hypothetical protein